MLKHDELSNPESCLNKARDHEPIFVLLGRDAAARHAIHEWIAARINLGKNKITDPQIIEALECARMMHKNFHCKGCGWEGPYYKASVRDDEPPTCPICG